MQCSCQFAFGWSASDNVANLSDRIDQRSVNRAQKCLLFRSRTTAESTSEVSVSGERELAPRDRSPSSPSSLAFPAGEDALARELADNAEL